MERKKRNQIESKGGQQIELAKKTKNFLHKLKNMGNGKVLIKGIFPLPTMFSEAFFLGATKKPGLLKVGVK